MFVLLFISDVGGEDCLVKCDNDTQEKVLKEYCKEAHIDDGTEVVINSITFDSLEDVKKFDAQNNWTVSSVNYLTEFFDFQASNEDFDDFIRNSDFVSSLSSSEMNDIVKS